MAQAKNKTAKNDNNVAAYLDGIKAEDRRADCDKILEMMTKVSGAPPKMWGASIVGFGEYHYKYESGREGDSPRVGFSSRAQTIAVYLMPGYQDFSDELSRLGKHKMGKSCLNIKRLSDVDESVLEEMVQKSLDIMAEKYPLAD